MTFHVIIIADITLATIFTTTTTVALELVVDLSPYLSCRDGWTGCR